MSDNKRNRFVSFRVSDKEYEMIKKRMEQSGIQTLRAYLLKMAIDGYVLYLDLTEIQKMVSLLGNSASNMNQIARRVNSTGNIYSADVQDMKDNYDKLFEQTNKILGVLTDIQAKEVL
ncbi:MAG: plasmid mobilization protein [Lachnospiraceae bacterium]